MLKLKLQYFGHLMWRIHLQCDRPGFDPWFGKIPWRRQWLLTPVSWPGEFHGLYSPWDRKELDTTERLSLSLNSTFACFTILGKSLLWQQWTISSILSTLRNVEIYEHNSENHVTTFRYFSLPDDLLNQFQKSPKHFNFHIHKEPHNWKQ